MAEELHLTTKINHRQKLVKKIIITNAKTKKPFKPIGTFPFTFTLSITN